MKYRQLGRTDLEVSLICLGSRTWGRQCTESEAHQQLDYATAEGINFIDTAEIYPSLPDAESYGRCEQIIGSWLKKRGARHEIIIATKVAGHSHRLPFIRDGDIRLDRKNIIAAVDDSLKRLQTDYIDLYQTHWPDRDTNCLGQLGYFHVPEKDLTAIEETLETLNTLVNSGKIRHIGVSNETPWGVAEYLRVSGQIEVARIASIQNPYNLLNRTFEVGLAEICQREQISLLAYSPTAEATLSGKYLNNQQPEGSKPPQQVGFARYKGHQANFAIEAYVELARNAGIEPIQMALAFVNARPFITSTIVGASKMEQLKANINSINIELPKEVIKGIEKIHLSQPNPCP